MNFRRRLRGQSEMELIEQQLQVLFRLRVAAHHDLAAVAGGQVDVDHLHGGEFFQHGPRSQPAGGLAQPRFERDLEAVGEEANEGVRFDARFELVMKGAQGQIAFEFFEGLLDFR